jgi:hypothetical protein
MLIRSFKGALVTGIAIVALITAQEVARAGQYHVYSCRMPDGQSAPTDGWSGTVAAGGAWDDYVLNTCSEGGAMVAGLGDATPHAANVDLASWQFSSPVGARLAAASVWRAGDLPGGQIANATYQFWLAGPERPAVFDECIFTQACSTRGNTAVPQGSANQLSVPVANLGTAIYANVSCGGAPERSCPSGVGDPNGFAAALYLYAADLTLEQSEGPHAANVAGELASAPILRGSPDVSFDATDPGAGVYEAVFAIDGQPLQRTVLNDNGGRCRDVGETTDGLPAFFYLQPCPQSISADVPFDSTRAANGAHRLTVSVLDAAGNSAPVLNRIVTIDNPPPPGAPNGANASSPANLSVRWSGTAKTGARGGFSRAHTVTGRLTASGGAPIAGAFIEVRATPAYSGARAVAMTSPRTDARGGFALRVPAGTSSRTLRFAYRAHIGDPQPAAIRALRLRTPASVALSVTPHGASAGSSIYFRGRLRGDPIPRDGKSLVLEARSPGSGWLQFKVIRTDRRGRFHASYRFKFPGPADYSFRLRCEAESDFPFAAGYSNVVGVHER